MSVCAIGCQQLFFLVCSMTRAVERLNERELQQGAGKSWHDDYKDSAYIFIGNLDYMLTEGDVLTVFSQCVFLVPPPFFPPLPLLCKFCVLCTQTVFHCLCRYGEPTDINLVRDKVCSPCKSVTCTCMALRTHTHV